MHRRTRHILVGTVAAALASATLALAIPRPAPLPSCASPEVHITKRDASLDLLCGGVLARSFPVTFGARPQGPKEQQGDERTPEGEYRITSRLVTPRFHKFLGISYPNELDLQRAAARGIHHPGSGIGIHGVTSRKNTLARIWIRLGAASHLSQVWGPTDGCIALTNENVDVVYDAVRVGSRVVISP